MVVAEVATGYGSITLIEGPAGIGKTRLLNEAFIDANVPIKRAAARELEQGRSFGVLRDALGLQIDSTSTAQDEEEQDRAHLFLRVERIIDSIEKETLSDPFVLVLEDLHWIDEPSCLVIDRVIENASELPIALVFTFRPDPAPTALQIVRQNATRSNARTFSLHALSSQEQDELVTDIVAGDVGPHLARTVAGASGNPLFLEEVLTSLRDEGGLVRDGDAVDTEVDIAPSSFRLAILRRFSSLPESTLAILRTAAALGGAFHLSDLAIAVGLSISETERDLRPAIAGGLLTEDGPRLAFEHDLVRDAIYYDSPEPVRIAIHRELAARLSTANSTFEMVAEQAYRGARPGDHDCIEWLRNAGRSLSAAAPVAATKYLEKALELSIDSRQEAAIASELVVPLTYSARLYEAEKRARAAIELLQDPLTKARLRADLGHVLYLQDDYQTGFAEMKGAAETPGLDRGERARLLALMVSTANEYSADLEAAAQEALTIANENGDLPSQALALIGLSKLARGRADLSAALSLAERAHSVARLSGDVPTQLSILIKIPAPLIHLDRFDEARAHLDDAIKLAERTGNTWLLPQFIGGLGMVSFLAGDWDDAQRDLDESLQNLPVPAEKPVPASFLAVLYSKQGNIGRAEEVLAAHSPHQPVEDVEPQYRWACAQVAAGKNDLPSAVDHIRSVVDHYEQAWGLMALWTGADLIPLLVRAQALDLARRFLVRVESVASAVESNLARATPFRCRGALENDPEQLETAIEALSNSPRRPLIAETHLDAATLLSVRGDKERAIAHARSAHDIFQRLGADPSLRNTRALLRSLGAPTGIRGPRARPATGWAALTRSEASVAELVAEGLPNREIAERLFVSKKTVESHLGSAFRKLGIRSRVELARLALQEAARADQVRKDPE